MNRNRQLFFALCVPLLFGTLAGVSKAQSNAATAPAKQATWAKNQASAQDAKVSGSIQEVVSQQRKGSPRGTQVVVAGPQGVFNANLGPFLSEDVKKSLAAGENVTLSGFNTTSHGKAVFVVRELTVQNGKTVTIRNENGFLVRPVPAPGAHATNAKAVNGGLR